MENETLEEHTNGPYKDFQRFVNILKENQFKETTVDDRIKNAVYNSVIAVGNRKHDAFFLQQ